ncbi:MAG: SGNH/GDSL hydrolase family protein [Gemmataceae bacterium]
MTARLVALAAAALVAAGPTFAADPFRFKDGDRVVFLGSTLIEREQKTGHWEYALTAKNADVNVTFRNLGWSGDTVWGEARNGFDESPKGFERLVMLTKELKPTVIIVCYGHNESFAGPAGVAKFADGLNKLLDALAPTQARIVLMTPTPFENTPPVTDAGEKNVTLTAYCQVIRDAATKRQHGLLDMWAVMPPGEGALTDNGLHLTPDGYRRTAAVFGPGRTTENASLLAAIARKNELFFHRWRPQNETYLFGFRKHEQGKNAAEVVAFDPLVAEAEKRIQELKTQPT